MKSASDIYSNIFYLLKISTIVNTKPTYNIIEYLNKIKSIVFCITYDQNESCYIGHFYHFFFGFTH